MVQGVLAQSSFGVKKAADIINLFSVREVIEQRDRSHVLFRMVVTADVNLPTEEELTVQEIEISTPGLRAAAFHLGKACENINNEFMLCRQEYKDPRKCLAEGKAVTACSLDFFRKIKKNCAEEFQQFSNCLDRSSSDFSLAPCRKTQSLFDKCMLDNLKIERPYFGYFSEVKVHHTERPRPEGIQVSKPEVTPDLSGTQEGQTSKFGNRTHFFN